MAEPHSPDFVLDCTAPDGRPAMPQTRKLAAILAADVVVGFLGDGAAPQSGRPGLRVGGNSRDAAKAI